MVGNDSYNISVYKSSRALIVSHLGFKDFETNPVEKQALSVIVAGVTCILLLIHNLYTNNCQDLHQENKPKVRINV